MRTSFNKLTMLYDVTNKDQICLKNSGKHSVDGILERNGKMQMHKSDFIYLLQYLISFLQHVYKNKQILRNEYNL